MNALADQISQLAQKIRALIKIMPRRYPEVEERFFEFDFQSITRALAKLHADEKLWQNPRGRMCIRGSGLAAKPPVRN